jgi:hypothetical protein
MSKRARELAGRLDQVRQKVNVLVSNCTEADWGKQCKEEWSLGVVARHVAAGHFAITDLAKMIINGQPLPELTGEQLVQMANDHAREHADCTREEVLQLLQDNGQSLIDFVSTLSDGDLDKTGELALVGGPVSTQQLIEYVLIDSAGEHIANMEAALND